jgi:hypothetical protein
LGALAGTAWVGKNSRRTAQKYQPEQKHEGGGIPLFFDIDGLIARSPKPVARHRLVLKRILLEFYVLVLLLVLVLEKSSLTNPLGEKGKDACLYCFEAG